MSNSEWHADQAIGEKAQRVWEKETEGLRAAVKIAREKGEHYPVCGMPPRDVMNDREAHRAWTEAKYKAWSTPEGKKAWWAEHCVCWKAEMEAALKGT